MEMQISVAWQLLRLFHMDSAISDTNRLKHRFSKCLLRYRSRRCKVCPCKETAIGSTGLAIAIQVAQSISQHAVAIGLYLHSSAHTPERVFLGRCHYHILLDVGYLLCTSIGSPRISPSPI